MGDLRRGSTSRSRCISFGFRLPCNSHRLPNAAAVLAHRSPVDVDLRDGRRLEIRLGNVEGPHERVAVDGYETWRRRRAFDLEDGRAAGVVVRDGDRVNDAGVRGDVDRPCQGRGQQRPVELEAQPAVRRGRERVRRNAPEIDDDSVASVRRAPGRAFRGALEADIADDGGGGGRRGRRGRRRGYGPGRGPGRRRPKRHPRGREKREGPSARRDEQLQHAPFRNDAVGRGAIEAHREPGHRTRIRLVRLREDAADDADGGRDGGGRADDVRVGQIDQKPSPAIRDADVVARSSTGLDVDLRAPR